MTGLPKAGPTGVELIASEMDFAKALLPQLADRVPEATLAAAVDSHRAVAANRALVASFFDRFLKGRVDHLLDGGASPYPITFVRQG